MELQSIVRKSFLLVSFSLATTFLWSQSRSIFDLLIAGDLNPGVYQKWDAEYLLSQVSLGHFDLDTLLSGEGHSLDHLALAIQYSKVGDFQSAERYWALINTSRSNLDTTALIFINLEYAAHLVRKNILLSADSIYRKMGSYLELHQASIPPYLEAYFFEQRGFCRYLQSDLSQAQKYFIHADSIWQIYPVEFHPWRINYWNHYGLLMTGTGEYEKAETSFVEALRLADLNRAGSQVQFADIYSNLGNLSRLLGDYDQALVYFEKAKLIYSARGLLVERATLLNNMALTYDLADSLDRAVTLYQEALMIYERQLGTNNLAYATILNNLAGLLDYLGQLEEAEIKYLQCIEAISSILGEENTYYTTVLNNLALVYESMGKPLEAEKLYLKALEIRKNVLGAHHPKYVELLYNYAGLCSYLAPERSLEIYREANLAQLVLLRYYYSSFDEDTRIHYLDEIKPEFEKFYATAVQNASPALAEEMVNFNLATKGLATRLTIDNRKRIAQSDAATQGYYIDWQLLRDSLAQAIILSQSERNERNIDLEPLIDKVDMLEKNWTRGLDRQDLEDVSFRALKNALDPDEIAVDFISFEWYEDGEWKDTIWYYALIIDPLKEYPEVIKVACDQAFNLALLYAHYGQLSKSQQAELSKMILDPLEPFFRNKRKILLCPTGILHKIPVSALHLNDEFLLDKYDIEIYGDFSSRVGSNISKSQRGISALLVGGLDYSRKSDYTTIATFPFIDGSGEEVLNIERALHGMGWKTAMMEHDQATHVRVLRELRTNKYSILHFATHGYVFKQMDNATFEDASLRNRIVTSINALLRTGLALSGVNLYWLSEPDLSESGVLSAYDIAQLDLHKTSLVVLSACESGMGDIHPDEGVFGLPRAFKLAGAEKVIYTLWKIEDQSSAEFLSMFYKYFAKSGDVNLAFRKTQKKMKRKYTPSFWAGFTLIN